MSNTIQHTNMKDSGIKWIGEIPASWNVRTLYQLVTRVNNKNSDLAEQNLLSLSYGKIKRKDINTNDGLLPASFDGYNVIEAGDIVLRLTDLQNDHTSLRVGQATERGIITSAYTTLRPINPAHSRYLYYLIHAFDLKKGFYGMGSGVRQGLNYDEVKELRVVIPSQKEQEAMVAYLDEVCIQIDSLIREAKDSISEYKQWKESLIFYTLTQGLDSTIPLKESGVNWIGRIPENSSVVRMRYLVDGYKAGPFGSSLITDKLNSSGSILVYTPEHIAKQSAENEKNLYLPEDRREQMSQFFVQKGDIIFPIVGSLGRAMLITEDMPEGIINQRLAKFRIKEDVIDMDFFLWFFARSSFYNQFIEVNCRGSFILNLTKTIIYDMPVILPENIEKQREIADYLNRKCSTIDSLIKEKEILLDDLEFYKRSLIYETITGKRKVV